MIRSGHVFYDIRRLLGSTKVILGAAAFAAFFVLFVNLQCLYGFIVMFIALVAVRGVIGRRCPQCDAQLKEVDAQQDSKNAMVLFVIWRCPKDGYEEKEEIKGDSGLFGVR